MPTVEILDLNNVTVDGHPFSLVDAVLNCRDAAPVIHDALTVWATQHDADLLQVDRANAASMLKEATDLLTEQLNEAKAALDAMTAQMEAFQKSAQNWQQRFQEAADANGKLATANQQLTAERDQANRQSVASMNLAMQAMSGTRESAIAAAQEWHAVDADALDAASAAKKARLATNG